MTVSVPSPGLASPLTMHLPCQLRRRILPTLITTTMPDASSENGGRSRTSRTAIPRRFKKNGQLEIHLGVFQVALNAAEEEASAVRAWLAESNATVAGKTSSMNDSILISTFFILIVFSDRQP